MNNNNGKVLGTAAKKKHFMFIFNNRKHEADAANFEENQRSKHEKLDDQNK